MFKDLRCDKVGKEIIIGEKRNSWTVLGEVPKDLRPYKRERHIYVRCDCGTESVITLKNFWYDKSKACTKCRTQKSNAACTRIWEPIEANDHYLIPLNNGYYTLIDKEDLDKVIGNNWFFNRGYASNSDRDNSRTRLLHRIIHNTPNGMITHHINGNKLDNRKSNLETMSREDHCLHHNDYIHSFKKRWK